MRPTAIITVYAGGEMQLDLFEKVEERTRKSSAEKILQALKQAGHHGLYNYELSKIGGLSWHRRIGNLRDKGYNIQPIRITKGKYKYILHQEEQ